MNVRTLFRVALSALACVILSGCASFPPSQPLMYPYARFAGHSPESLGQVENVLRWGDEYRNAAYNAYFDRNDWAGAYWYGEEAKKFYKRVLDELEPNNAYAAVCMGYIPLMLARGTSNQSVRDLMYGQAFAMFKQADQNRKGYADAHKYMGELYAMQKQWVKAEGEFSALVKAGIENAYIHAWWAYVLSRKGNIEGANLHLQKAVDCAYPEQAATWARRTL